MQHLIQELTFNIIGQEMYHNLKFDLINRKISNFL